MSPGIVWPAGFALGDLCAAPEEVASAAAQLQDRIRAQATFMAQKACEESRLGLDQSAAHAVQDVAANFAVHISRELWHFARHAGRSRVTPAEVLLMARNNPTTRALLEGAPLPPIPQAAKRAAGSGEAVAPAAPPALRPVPTLPGPVSAPDAPGAVPAPLTVALDVARGSGHAEARQSAAGVEAGRVAIPAKRGAAGWVGAPRIRQAAAERALALRRRARYGGTLADQLGHSPPAHGSGRVGGAGSGSAARESHAVGEGLSSQEPLLAALGGAGPGGSPPREAALRAVGGAHVQALPGVEACKPRDARGGPRRVLGELPGGQGCVGGGESSDESIDVPLGLRLGN